MEFRVHLGQVIIPTHGPPMWTSQAGFINVTTRGGSTMKMGRSTLFRWGVLPLLILVASACSSEQKAAPEQEAAVVSDTPTFDVTSSAFQQGAAIPARYTCDGDNVSPPIAWTAVPEGTQSIAVISYDPDAGAPGSIGSCTEYPRKQPGSARTYPPGTPSTTAPPMAPATFGGVATEAHARPAARTGTSSKSMPWTRKSTWRPAPRRRRCWKRWKATYWPQES